MSSLGPIARAAMALPVEGRKRRKVLVLIAAYADAGRPDPSIRELAKRASLPRLAVMAAVDRLEQDGLLEVRRVEGERNRYTIPVGGSR